MWSTKPDPCDPEAKPDYLELKTTAEIKSDRDIPKFESKLRKMWAQSYLLGVPKIMIGFRDGDMDGTLLRLKEYRTRDIPDMIVEQAWRRGQQQPAWDSNCCINFLGEFLKCKFYESAVRYFTLHVSIWRHVPEDGLRRLEGRVE